MKTNELTEYKNPYLIALNWIKNQSYEEQVRLVKKHYLIEMRHDELTFYIKYEEALFIYNAENPQNKFMQGADGVHTYIRHSEKLDPKRCLHEQLVERYFGLPYRVSENQKITTDVGILTDFANDVHQYFENEYNDTKKQYALECIKADRIQVAENAKIAYGHELSHWVDKESILTCPIADLK